MAKRIANHQLVKLHRNYTVDDISRLLGVHKNTVRTWIKEGLPVCDRLRPLLVLGFELQTFLRSRRVKNKRPCKPDELYCFRCRTPRTAAGGMADCTFETGKVGMLQAICPVCFCMMNRRINRAQLDSFASILTITQTRAPEQVSNTTQANVSCDFENGA